MPRLRALRATPWGRALWLAQIVVAGIRELDPSERRHARDLVQKIARERRLSPKDREQLGRLAKKAGRGGIRGARGGSLRRR
jgi:arginase family enzyme